MFIYGVHLAEFLAILGYTLGILAKKNVRSRETRKNRGNLEAAVKGIGHGGLAGMHTIQIVTVCIR